MQTSRNWVRAADILFTVIMLATGLAIAGDHTGWSALFISFGIGAALAFLDHRTDHRARGLQTGSRMSNVWEADDAEREAPEWTLNGHMLLWSDGSPAHAEMEPFRRVNDGWEADLKMSRSVREGTRWLPLLVKFPASVRKQWDAQGKSQRHRALAGARDLRAAHRVVPEGPRRPRAEVGATSVLS